MKIAITKSTLFQGRQEEYSNVYVIDGMDVNDESGILALIDSAAAAEKAIMANDVNFVRGQAYSFGSFGPNFMYGSKPLSGAGALTPDASLYRETCIMLRAPLPRKFSLSRSVKPYLRKYLHCNVPHGRGYTGTSLRTYGTPPASLNTYIAFLNNPGSGLNLESESGATPIGSWEISAVLEHRQFPRGRKE